MTAATSKRRSLERRTPKHNPAWPNWASGYFATLPAPLPVRRPGFLILRALFNLKRSCLTYLNPLKRVQVNRSTPAMPPCQAHFPQHHDRRQFLLKAGGGIGGLALAGLLQQEPNPAKRRAIRWHRAIPLCPSSQARHLVVHARRAKPHGPVRSQAGLGQTCRPTFAG